MKSKRPLQKEIERIQETHLGRMTDRQIQAAEDAIARSKSHMENRVSMTPRIRAPSSTRKTVLTPQQAKEIRARYIPFIIGKKRLADEYGVSVSTVLKIIRNQLFKQA